MRSLLTSILFLTTLVVVGQDHSNVTFIKLDSSDIEFTFEELVVAEDLLKEAVREYNSDNDQKLRKLTDYKRQYVVSIDSTGQKVAWVNCFCGNFDNWKKNLVLVEDGGTCYFNLAIYLNERRYSKLQVNGNA